MTWVNEPIKINNPQPGSNIDAIWNFTCQENNCLGIGTDSTAKINYVLNSSDAGVSWNSQSALPTTSQYYSLNSINTTIFVTNTDDFNKGILFSKDKGISWSSAKISFPQNYKEGFEITTKCLSNLCMKYWLYQTTDSTDKWKFLPMVLISNSDATSWQAVPISTSFNDYITGDEATMDCTNDACIIIGNHTPSPNYSNGAKPFIISLQQDQNGVWKSTEIQSPLLNSPDLWLRNISCQTNTCNIVGADGDGPLLLTSADNGMTWAKTSNFVGLKEKFNDLFFFTYGPSNNNVSIRKQQFLVKQRVNSLKLT